MDIEQIYDLLRQLGLPADRMGFFYVSYAVYLFVRQPNLTIFAELWLYPKVARHYGTDRGAVKRGICAALDTVWTVEPERLAELARRPLERKPEPAEFLAILASYFSTGFAA